MRFIDYFLTAGLIYVMVVQFFNIRQTNYDRRKIREMINELCNAVECTSDLYEFCKKRIDLLQETIKEQLECKS